MNHSSSPRDHPLSTAMSELDSFSDSEWLDISSGRDSDDNDSLTDQDSDRDEISSMPRSRRSSISNDSAGGDVEAWEGFVSDSGDEASEPLIGMYPVPLPSALGSEPIAVGFVPNSVEAADPAQAEEDQRVREALDQSFVSTLSNSRSSTGAASTHTSIRDLRLSFPDPLASSKDELSRSYEAVSSPAESTATTDTDTDVNDVELTLPMISSIPLADPGSSATTPEVQHHKDVELVSEDKSELDIVLYGSSSEIKWKFVQELIQKAAITSGHVWAKSFEEGEQVQTLSLSKESNNLAKFFNTINVYDRTIDGMLKPEIDYFHTSNHPSLAIVYLPTSTLPVLTWHTSFFPVLLPAVPSADGEKINAYQVAEDDWDLLAVPVERTLKLGSGESFVFDSEKLVDMKPTDVYTALRSIGYESKKNGAMKPLTEQIKSVNAVTIFALMSIVMGFAFNTAFRPPAPTPTPTVNTPSSSSGQIWGIFAPQPNRSLVGSSTVYTDAKGSVSGHDMITSSDMSVYDARMTSISVTSPPSSMSLIVASTSKAVAEITTSSPVAKCKQCTSSDRPRASTDVIVRSASATALAEVPQGKASLAVVGSSTVATLSGSPIVLGGAKSTIASAASAAASVNFNTVSEVFDATTKALSEAVGSDLSELAEAADELLASLRVQRDNVIRQSKGKARAIGEQIQNLNEEVAYRNERAKKRARELKQRGEEMVRGAKETLMARTGRAKRRAKELRKTVVESGSEAWKSYGKAQEEWEGVLLGKTKRRQGRQEWKHGRPVEKRQEKRKVEKENHPRTDCWKGFSARRCQG